MIKTYNIHIFVCQCDRCGEIREVQESLTAYNAAQAARSIGWSYGKDKKTFCRNCRKQNLKDKYK